MTPEPKVAPIPQRDESAEDAEWRKAELAARLAETSEKPGEPAPAEDLDEASGIPPRDLRRARRRAKRLGLSYADDMDAYRQIKARGIDLNEKTSFLDMVPPTPKTSEPEEARGPLVTEEPDILDAPQPAPAPAEAKAPAPVDDSNRAEEIKKIQRGLVRRRRRRLALLLTKLAFFVMLPSFLVGHYYYQTASPMYETSAEFVIQKSESSGGAGIGGLFSGTGFATSQDSITVQGFLTSIEAMRRLDWDHGFIAHFQQEEIDDIQRLAEDATEDDAYKLYQRRVKVGFDPTEGIIRMSVIAADPEASERFNQALIGYAEERVDNLSLRVRTDQMAGAQASYDRAEEDLRAAQDRVLDLQQQRGILSAEAEISAQMSLISSLEMEREMKSLDLAEILANPRPNQTRAGVLEAELARLDGRIGELREEMTDGTDQRLSLARITAELRVAEADLANRQLMLQTALQQLETARVEANRQVRYLSIGVTPLATDTASYPRKLENTALGFVIFMGLYILVSLTVSILREQVSV